LDDLAAVTVAITASVSIAVAVTVTISIAIATVVIVSVAATVVVEMVMAEMSGAAEASEETTHIFLSSTVARLSGVVQYM